MVRAGLCTILASDYYYPALALAPFLLARRGAATFAEAWRLVSQAPAQALGLDDRGVIAPGRRADLVLVEDGAASARRRDHRRRQAGASRRAAPARLRLEPAQVLRV